MKIRYNKIAGASVLAKGNLDREWQLSIQGFIIWLAPVMKCLFYFV
ncbi:hypothetical protein I6N96_17830 [Enterococcus sp. BWM-S5]|uniref:Uncharacterized protein n=1 Tax=Enterococcus larvae TaxID=2794352 RepID=A0ABS4CNJ6_9ENTE|nr:hypothetical protein [Enterococcus larvae]MBP1048156.1 hypothetical protein [Enterococcus larvae]